MEDQSYRTDFGVLKRTHLVYHKIDLDLKSLKNNPLLKDLPGMMDDRDRWRKRERRCVCVKERERERREKRVREIRAVRAT